MAAASLTQPRIVAANVGANVAMIVGVLSWAAIAGMALVAVRVS